MKRRKYFKSSCFVFNLIIICISAGTGKDTINSSFDEERIRSSIIYGKQLIHTGFSTSEPDSLLKAIEHFRKHTIDSSYSWLAYYYIGLANYRLGSYYKYSGKNKKANQYYDAGIQYLDKLNEIKKDYDESYCLLSDLYGEKIGISKGKKRDECISVFYKNYETTNSLNPNNPRQRYIWGVSRYATDEKYGGGKEKAKEVFKEAIGLFILNSPKDNILPSWGYDEAYGWLARVYFELKQYQKATECVDNALKINPENKIIKEVIKPKIEDKLD